MERINGKIINMQIGNQLFVMERGALVWKGAALFALLNIIDNFFLLPLVTKLFSAQCSLVCQVVDFIISLIIGAIILWLVFALKSLTISRKNFVVDESEIFCDRAHCRAVQAINGKLKDIPLVCQLFAAQSDDINQQTQTAAEDIIKSITVIESAVSAMSQNIKNAIADAEEIKKAEHMTAKMLEQGLAELSAYLRAALNERLEKKQNIEAVIAEAASLTKLTTYVKSIASQTNLLSVNAAVEAARAGTHGKGFSVVSEEIRNLSIHSEKTSAEIERRINGLITSIDTNLASMADEQANQANTQKLTNFVDQVKQMSQLSKRVEELNATILTTIENDSEAITTAVMDALGSIQFQDITRQRLEQIKAGLVAVVEQLESVICYGCQPEELEAMPDLDVAEMKKSYHMQAQRDVHSGVVGDNFSSSQEKTADLPQIELF